MNRFVRVGDIRKAHGRAFEALAVAPYTRVDGKESQLVNWRAWCRACGAPYETGWASRSVKKLALNCFEHIGARAPNRR